MQTQPHKVLLIGNPNCGKSTLFNTLTGLKQKISNLPGTTIEQKKAIIHSSSASLELIDLPGLYTLQNPIAEEVNVVNFLQNQVNTNHNISITCIVDANNLRRNLLLVKEIASLGKPISIILTMMDMVKKSQKKVDILKLRNELNVPILAIDARKSIHVSDFFELVKNAKPVDWNTNNTEKNTIEKYVWIENLVKKVETLPESLSKKALNIWDKLATHKLFGFVLLFLILSIVFQTVFTLAQYPMDWIELGFNNLTKWLSATLPTSVLSKVFIQGFLPGIAGVLVFVPQIALLFLLIAILEDSGYLTRVSYITDFPMRKLGLNGKSVIPLLGGFACAIPGIMSTRVIENRYERLLTMFILPLMACSARLPVYVLIINLCIPTTQVFGFLNLQGLVMTLLYLSGIAMAAIISIVFKKVKKNKKQGTFILELAPYQWPRLKNVWNTVFYKSKSFVVDAGKIIVLVSIILWFASNYGPKNAMDFATNKAIAEANGNSELLNKLTLQYKLENSYAGIAGKFIEPAIAPLGYDWKTGIAIISSFAAREVFVGTLNVLFAIEQEDTSLKLVEKMKQSRNSITKTGKYDLAYGVSLLLFYAFALQCASTIAVMRKEVGSWKLPITQLVVFTAIAYISAWLAYNTLA